MGQTDYFALLRKQLSIDFNCAPEDFLKTENILTESAANEGRRFYSEEKFFFQMVTLGGNAIISADKRLHPFLRDYMDNAVGHWLFEQPRMIVLEKELNNFGFTLALSHHMFLPQREVKPAHNYPTKWFYGREQIEQFYGDKRFPNAICESYCPKRPDIIAVCAYDGGNIMGMAGCSEDAPHWQQIGIDVMPEYRSAGVGTFLVTLLKNEILRRGDIPFYGTSLSNYHSWNIALNSGFKPAWVEIEARKSGK